MKTAVFAFCFLCTGCAFSQTATVLSNQAQPVQMQDHPQRATEHFMTQETTLLSVTPYTYAKGEVPLAELGSPIYHEPLGDIARANKKEHVAVPKAAKIFEN